MNLILEQLQNDHKQLVRLLYQLEQQVKTYMGLIKASSSLESMLDILDYIQVYPELWHHPTEDIICDVLLEKDISVSGEVADLMAEHDTLELLSENIHEYINQLAVAKYTVIAEKKARFIKASSLYINRQLQHMEKEQEVLFPLFEQRLDSSDWDKIRLRLKDKQKLIDEKQLQQYKTRYYDIANRSAIGIV